MQIIGIPSFIGDHVLDHDLTNEIRILASLIFKVSTLSIEQRLNEKGVNISMLQCGILRLLGHESFTLSELSRKMLLDPSTLVPSIDSLVKKGLVVKQRDPNDRRRMPLTLTQEAHNLLRDLHQLRDDDPLVLALQSIGEADVKQLRDTLRKVVFALPDGEEMLEQIHQRLQALKGASENLSNCQKPSEEI